MRRLAEPGYGYLTANDPRVHFGLGNQAGPLTLGLKWPDGLTEELAVPEVDRIVKPRREAR